MADLLAPDGTASNSPVRDVLAGSHLSSSTSMSCLGLGTRLQLSAVTSCGFISGKPERSMMTGPEVQALGHRCSSSFPPCCCCCHA